jgi:DNA-binding Xre family transcriptional regulator
VILNNKKSSRFVKLTLADKLYLIKLSKRIKKDGSIDSITFEEFTLLCKHHRKNSTLRVESKYSTSFINILQFDMHTLHILLYKIINEIELYKETDKYNNIDDVINLLRVTNVILFDTYEDICKSLDVKIIIE